MVLAETEEEFIQLFDRLNENFQDYPKLLAYVNSTWIDKYKEKFIACWTDTIMYLKIHQQTCMLFVILLRYCII